MPRGPQPGRSEDRLALSAHLEPLLQESNTLEKRLPVNTSTAEGLNRKLLHTCPPAKGRSRKAVWEIQRSPERRDAYIHESTLMPGIELPGAKKIGYIKEDLGRRHYYADGSCSRWMHDPNCNRVIWGRPEKSDTFNSRASNKKCIERGEFAALG